MKVPTFEDVSRAFSEHRGGEIPDFIRAFPDAEAMWRDLEQLKNAAQASPRRAPTPEELVAREVQLLQTVSRLSEERRFAWWKPAAGLAAAGIAAAVAWSIVAPSESAREDHLGIAVITSLTPETRYEHFSTSNPDHAPGRAETVRVSNGKLTFKVPEVEPTSRFRVLTEDAEIVLSSGGLEVGVVDGRLMKLQMLSGRAELRRAHGETLTLDAGHFWQRSPVPTPMSPVTRENADAHPSARPQERGVEQGERKASVLDAAAAEAPSPTNPNELAYADAWSLLETGLPSRAADRFADVSDGPLAREALYWRGVALARAHRGFEAEATFARYLELYPKSDRGHEVTVLIGFLALERGAVDEARIRFEAGLLAPSPSVRTAAQQGLDALARGSR